MTTQEEIQEYLDQLVEEMDERGVLYEKYGSGISSVLSPLLQQAGAARHTFPGLTLKLLKAVFE